MTCIPRFLLLSLLSVAYYSQDFDKPPLAMTIRQTWQWSGFELILLLSREIYESQILESCLSRATVPVSPRLARQRVPISAKFNCQVNIELSKRHDFLTSDLTETHGKRHWSVPGLLSRRLPGDTENLYGLRLEENCILRQSVCKWYQGIRVSS